MWKAVPGYEGLYEISDNGDVATLSYNKTGVRKLLKFGNSRGYLTVELSAKRFTVHRLVMLAFVGPRPTGMHINHIDGIKVNNRLSNLEYCTPSENQKHSFEAGLQDNRGENHSQNKLTESDVRYIREQLKSRTQTDIAKEFNVDPSAICNIKRRRNWAHLE